MGVLHGRDLLSSKYITAEIKDASKRLWYVPIKHTIGDYFLADLAGQVYCFKIDNEICQYREKLTRSFRVIQYDTTHYRPIKSNVKDLERILAVNDLPKVDGMLADIFRILGSKEKKKFVPHRLMDMVKDLSKYNTNDTGKTLPKIDSKYATQIESIIQYLNNLNIDEIATPVRSVSDFIEDDLRATDPKFLGTVATTLQNLDFENKKVTNTPVKATMAWAKWVIVIMGIVLVIVFVAYGIDQGWFDSVLDITKSFEGLEGISLTPPTLGGSGGVKNNQYYQDNFTPEELRAAIDRGEVDEDTLPAGTKAMVANIKSVEVVPNP